MTCRLQLPTVLDPNPRAHMGYTAKLTFSWRPPLRRRHCGGEPSATPDKARWQALVLHAGRESLCEGRPARRIKKVHPTRSNSPVISIRRPRGGTGCCPPISRHPHEQLPTPADLPGCMVSWLLLADRCQTWHSAGLTAISLLRRLNVELRQAGLSDDQVPSAAVTDSEMVDRVGRLNLRP
jgi:hypothetical protein